MPPCLAAGLHHAPACRGDRTGRASGLGLGRTLDAVAALGQIKRRRKIGQLAHGQADAHHIARDRIFLFQNDTFFKCQNGHVLFQRVLPFVNQSDDGRIKIVFDCKHKGRVALQAPRVQWQLRRDLQLGVRSSGGPFVCAGTCYLRRKNLMHEADMGIQRLALAIGVAALLAACQPVAYPAGGAVVSPTPLPVPAAPAFDGVLPPEQAARNFVAVVNRVEPVAEAMCRERNPRSNCDFQIVVDDRPGQPPNAFQTLDRNGRPIVGFTLALIADARNADEIAFVVGHETAHHIAGHIPQVQRTAVTGAVLAGVLAQASGAPPDAVRAAQQMGANMGARTYAREFELEADALGAEIAFRSGFDPVRGSAFFDRLPDPGDEFLGSHPPNAQRKEIVRRVVAGLR